MEDILAGYKTYIIGLGAIFAGLVLINSGLKIEGMELIFLGLGFMGIKSAIKRG